MLFMSIQNVFRGIASLKFLEVIDEKTPENANDTINHMIMEKEGERIRNLIKEDSYIFSLAIEGKKFDSVKFATELRTGYQRN